jgi:hypothetical protein
MFCARLQSIKAVHCKGLNDTAIENIAQHCRSNITSVVLRACDDLTSASAYAIAANCPNLTCIDLSYGTTFSERSLIELASKCPHLQFINFEGLCNISDTVIATVAANCKQLSFFNIDYYKGMSHDGIDPVALKLIAESCTNIGDFVAPDFHYKVRQGKAQLKLKGVYTRLPKLRNILLNSPTNVTHLQTTSKLHNILICTCILNFVCILNLYRFECILNFVTLPVLVYTRIDCKYMNDELIDIVAERYKHNLITLLVNGCEDITDVSLAQLAQHCRQLTHIDLSCCGAVTDFGVTALVTSCPSLVTILLKKCILITDASILSVSEQLPGLLKLDLNGCKLITDSTLRQLSEHNILLRELDITNCDVVTKVAVQQIIATLPELNCQNFWQYYLQ